jgi:uncharacterized damage-inducible protein DinB
MSSTLNKEFKNLEDQLDALLHKVKPLRHDQQNFKPDPGAWSILQVFRHMIQSEGQINRYLRKKILGANTIGKAGVWAKVRSVVLNAAMRLPIKYKVPDAIQVNFEENYRYEELSAEWRVLRKELGSFLETIDEQTARKEIFRHPVVGRMSLVQGITFMQEHLARHTQQVERIMKHAEFPK